MEEHTATGWRARFQHMPYLGADSYMAVLADELEERAEKAEAEAARLRKALQKAHDVMDDENATVSKDGIEAPFCRWCNTYGYDGLGLKHADDCVLVLARAALEEHTAIRAGQ